MGVDVSDVDFLRRTVSVERQRLQGGRLGALKSPKSRRVVPLGQVTIDAPAAHLAAHPSERPLFTDELGEPMTVGPELCSVAGQTASACAWAFLAFLKSRTFCSDAGSVTSATER